MLREEWQILPGRGEQSKSPWKMGGVCGGGGGAKVAGTGQREATVEIPFAGLWCLTAAAEKVDGDCTVV